jgi:hypothetical protein
MHTNTKDCIRWGSSGCSQCSMWCGFISPLLAVVRRVVVRHAAQDPSEHQKSLGEECDEGCDEGCEEAYCCLMLCVILCLGDIIMRNRKVELQSPATESREVAEARTSRLVPGKFSAIRSVDFQTPRTKSPIQGSRTCGTCSRVECSTANGSLVSAWMISHDDSQPQDSQPCLERKNSKVGDSPRPDPTPTSLDSTDRQNLPAQPREAIAS